METRKLQSQLWLEQSLEEVWDFHKNPANLLEISPDFLKLHLEGVDGPVGKGSSFRIKTDNKLFKPFFKWTVKYADWGEMEDEKFFVDTQSDGPFQVWNHRHDFKRSLNEIIIEGKTFHPKTQGTWIFDNLEYALKPQFRKLEWVVDKMLTQLFVFRKRRLIRLFAKKD